MMNEVEVLTKSLCDVLDIHERTCHNKELSTFLPDQRDERVSKEREWSNASFTERAFTTTGEIHNEEGPLPKKRHANSSVKMCQSRELFYNQPCIYYGPETIEVLESIDIPETERDPKIKLKIFSDYDSDSSSEVADVSKKTFFSCNSSS
ncbi:hypothetical protein TNCV_934411 [Trichonephila clavipes]|nr:hypothetical protein TNCV_934411 [Trichonephila clavipes]